MDDIERKRLKARFKQLCSDSGYPETAVPGTSLREHRVKLPLVEDESTDGRVETISPDDGFFSPSKL